MRIDAAGLGYRDLNEKIHSAVAGGEEEIILTNVNGQRYICAGVKGRVRLRIEGLPGNDLGAFMDGPLIDVRGNGQDAIANTMNSGRIAIHGHGGDVLAYAMRGGELLVRDDVGYRVGIHMKAFRESMPVLVIGGTARDFLGEYMAGGVIIVLSLDGAKRPPAGRGMGSGAHGGAIYLRGRLPAGYLGKEMRKVRLTDGDHALLAKYILDYTHTFGIVKGALAGARFSKFVPATHRPYGKLYAY